MPPEMSAQRALALRQGLVDRTAPDARSASLACAGIQAQDLWASRLAVRARSRQAVLDDVVAAAATPTVARSCLMRGTLHMVAADDLYWLNDLIGPAVLRMAALRFTEVGLTEAVRDRARRALPEVLTGRALTRAELVAAVSARVPDLPVQGQARAYLTVWAAVCGLITRVAERGAEPTYALIEECLPARPDRLDDDEAMRRLLRRYFRAFGPATVEDFATWSGLLISAARRTFADIAGEFRTVTIDGRFNYLVDNDLTDDHLTENVEPARQVLRLLPAFDSYLLGYRGRDHILDPARGKEILVGGIIRPSILVDGVVVGTWRLDRARDPARLRAEFFTEPAPWLPAALHAEAEDIARFLGRPIALALVDRIG